MMNKSSSSSNIIGSISSSSHDLIDAKLEEHQLCGSKQCPGCGHKLEGKPDWLGLPAGVKFDPTDQELIEHLEAKVEAKLTKSHPLIDEFIPTIEGEDGICYTHPEKLPGVTRDGLSRHFFHRPSKAYTTGTRKRRKIQTECDLQGGETRWHKTGKTRPVMVNGKQKGCKKILVLYTNFGKNRKPEKTNWVMHQYHLGQDEEEKEGELVVSKIFYQTQPRQCNWIDRSNTNNAAAAATTTGEGSNSGSCSSKEILPLRDEISGHGLSTYVASMDHFAFAPFRKNFDEVGNIGGDGCEELRARQHHDSHDHLHVHQQRQQQQENHVQHASCALYNISRPSHSISTIISPPPPPLHQSSIILIDDPFHVPRLILPNDNFQEQQQQQHDGGHGDDDKVVGRSASSGLEELIMGCTSTRDTKQEESESVTNRNRQEAEWLKYSSSFWGEPTDNQDHHG